MFARQLKNHCQLFLDLLQALGVRFKTVHMAFNFPGGFLYLNETALQQLLGIGQGLRFVAESGESGQGAVKAIADIKALCLITDRQYSLALQ